MRFDFLINIFYQIIIRSTESFVTDSKYNREGEYISSKSLSRKMRPLIKDKPIERLFTGQKIKR